MRGRFHTGDIDLPDPFKMGQDARELRCDPLPFLRRQLKTRKIGDVIDIDMRNVRNGRLPVILGCSLPAISWGASIMSGLHNWSHL